MCRSPSIDAELVANVYASAVAPLTSKFASVWPAHECTFARFEWAYAVVSSRAFRLRGATEPTLLPVIDMANHDHADPAAEIVKLDDGSFEVRLWMSVCVLVVSIESLTTVRWLSYR